MEIENSPSTSDTSASIRKPKQNWFRRLFRLQISITGLLVLMTVAAIATPYVYKWATAQPDRIKVNSTSLGAVGYNSHTQTLEIRFNNGSIYQYFKVPEQVHRDLMNAKSHGSFFHSSIRQHDARP